MPESAFAFAGYTMLESTFLFVRFILLMWAKCAPFLLGVVIYIRWKTDRFLHCLTIVLCGVSCLLFSIFTVLYAWVLADEPGIGFEVVLFAAIALILGVLTVCTKLLLDQDKNRSL